MEKKNKKPLIFIALLFSVLLIVGGTIAYYTSSDTFENEFDTGTYEIETKEAFVSPDNWTPGTTTPKEVIATNKGNTMAAVRVKLTPSWLASDGVTTLPLTDGTNEAAIINYAFDKDYKWVKEGDWYYYVRPLDTDESTSSIIESVTFNPNVNISATHNCVEDATTHSRTCTTETTGYGDATYKLMVDIETCQFDKYQEVWNTNVDISIPEIKNGYLKNSGQDNSTVFGKPFSNNKNDFESIMLLDIIDVPSNAIDSWDASEQENNSIIAWYTDKDNNGKYELYIGQEGGVNANPDSEFAFSCYYLATYLNLKYLDTSEVTNMNYMFFYSGYNSRDYGNFQIEGLDNWDTSKVEDMSYMFSFVGRYNPEYSIGDLGNWNTSSVTNMEHMFDRTAESASSFDIGNIGSWDVSHVTRMNNMFDYAGTYAKQWNIGNLSSWDTSNVLSMENMFFYAGYGAIDWNNIGTLKIYADIIDNMFFSVKSAKATLNIYSNPTYYSGAFNGASTKTGSGITVNYSSTTTNINAIIATKSSNSNVVKGSQLD